MKNIVKYTFRIISLPFWMGLTFIGFGYQWLLINWNYILYGGEAFAYTKKHQKKHILDVYEIVKERLPLSTDIKQ